MPHPALLIADDEEAICFALSRAARRHGLTPLVAADGTRAVAVSHAAGADLVAMILDIRMPHADGISAALAILETRPAIDLALMTAFEERQLPPALMNPAYRLFRKPFDLGAFSTWLACVAARHPLAFDVVPDPAGAA